MSAKQIDRNDSRYILLDQMLFPSFDPYFARNLNRFFLLSLFLLILFGTLLFDVRISEGGDDSAYLLEAMKFSKRESFPSFHGTFYSMMIGWLIGLIGFHLVFFKTLSFLFLIGHQVLFFLTFRNRISPFLLSAVLLIMSVSSSIIYFGSQTYTEAFYLFLQSILFYLLINYLIEKPNNYQHITSSWKLYLGAGLTIFLLSTTRNIGIVALIAFMIFFLLERKYWPALYSLAGFLVFKIPYNLYKHFVWNIQESDFKGQLTLLLQKDPYNKALGNEQIGGMFQRFFENTNIYLSRIFLQEIGLKNNSNTANSIVITLIIMAILIGGFIMAFRANKSYIRMIFIYLGLALGATFVSLNQFWSQNRLIVPFVPLLLFSILWLPAKITENRTVPVLRFLIILLITFIFFKNLEVSIKDARENGQIRKEYKSGNRYAGYTPDYAHFLSLSEWAALHVPENVQIASRKASMSFIYSKGRIFYPINKISYENTDSVLSQAELTGKHVLIINDEELERQKKDQIAFLRRYMQSLISFDNAVYSLYTVPQSDAKQVDSLLQQITVTSYHSIQEFRKEVMAREKRKVAITPDNLLDELWRNNVHYLIDANLRINQAEKTDLTINTISRYMTVINSKYTGVFTMVKQIGNNNDEPARLFKIDYGKCRQMGWAYNGSVIRK